MQKVLAVLCPEPSCLGLPCFNWVYGALPFSREQLWGWGHHQMLVEHHQLRTWPLAVTGLDKSMSKSSFRKLSRKQRHPGHCHCAVPTWDFFPCCFFNPIKTPAGWAVNCISFLCLCLITERLSQSMASMEIVRLGGKMTPCWRGQDGCGTTGDSHQPRPPPHPNLDLMLKATASLPCRTLDQKAARIQNT